MLLQKMEQLGTVASYANGMEVEQQLIKTPVDIVFSDIDLMTARLPFDALEKCAATKWLFTILLSGRITFLVDSILLPIYRYRPLKKLRRCIGAVLIYMEVLY